MLSHMTWLSRTIIRQSTGRAITTDISDISDISGEADGWMRNMMIAEMTGKIS